MDGDLQGARLSAGAPTRRRWIARAVAIAACVAVLAPMFRSPAPDGFPLSTYPMFARDPGDRTWLDTAIGRSDDGGVRRLSSGLISGSDEPVLAAATVSRAVSAGAEATLCAQVARRVVERGIDGLVAIEVVSERHDLDRFAPDEPLERVVHTACPVEP